MPVVSSIPRRAVHVPGGSHHVVPSRQHSHVKPAPRSPSFASSCISGGVPISRYIRAQVTSTNAGGRMRRQGSSLGLVLVTSFLVGCSERQLTAPPNVSDLAASAEQLPAPTTCEHVSGAFVFSRFQFTSQTTAVGEGTMQGDLSGAFSAQYFDIEQRGNGVIAMRAHHTITRSTGTIRTSDEILLPRDQDPPVALPNSPLDVIGGTDACHGATAPLQ